MRKENGQGKGLKKKSSLRWARRVELIFYISIIGLPLLNYLLFQFFSSYIYTFIFVTQRYDPNTAKFVFQPDLLYNFRMFFDTFVNTPGFKAAVLNGLLLYALSWLLTPLGFFVSYYIYKKLPLAKAYRILLMLPGTIAGMVWVLLYKYLADRALPVAFNWDYGPLSNVNTYLVTLIVYQNWVGFGGGMLLYVGLMSGVSDSVIDAGRIDGLRHVGEFWHIILPAIYPVWSVFVITGVIGVFTGSPGTLEFFGYNADQSVYTIGYLMFTKVMRASGEDMAQYGFNAAGSLMFSLLVIPLTLTVKWALERFGPGEDTYVTRRARRAAAKERAA